MEVRGGRRIVQEEGEKERIGLRGKREGGKIGRRIDQEEGEERMAVRGKREGKKKRKIDQEEGENREPRDTGRRQGGERQLLLL